jgi:hypothetical protein
MCFQRFINLLFSSALHSGHISFRFIVISILGEEREEEGGFLFSKNGRCAQLNQLSMVSPEFLVGEQAATLNEEYERHERCRIAAMACLFATREVQMGTASPEE